MQTASTSPSSLPAGPAVDPQSRLASSTAAGGPGLPSPEPPAAPKRKRSFMDKAEAFISSLTSRSPFWHRVASMIWLPFAFRSGIRMKREGETTFSAVLPFKKFNRNWYNAMAGAALLGNSEIAGGMYIYGRCGGDYTVVCKELRYRFLRPCFGPAIYRVTPKNDLDALLKAGGEFNFDVEMEVVQQVPTRGLGREVRVGKVTATFHVTPKSLHEARKARREKAAAGQVASLPATAGGASGAAAGVAGATEPTDSAAR